MVMNDIWAWRECQGSNMTDRNYVLVYVAQ